MNKSNYVTTKQVVHGVTGMVIEAGQPIDLSHLSLKQIKQLESRGFVRNVSVRTYGSKNLAVLPKEPPAKKKTTRRSYKKKTSQPKSAQPIEPPAEAEAAKNKEDVAESDTKE